MKRAEIHFKLAAILLMSGAAILSVSGQVAVPLPTPGGRIQLNEWRDAKLGIADPLTQIVKITREGSNYGGTGFLLANCRIMTAAHVVSLGDGSDRLNHTRETLLKGDLLAERFQYETQPLPALGGRTARSEFVVIAHGLTAGSTSGRGEVYNTRKFVRGDWAIGYDESCMGDTLRLGRVDLGWTMFLNTPTLTGPAAARYAAESIGGRRLFTAGYSGITVPGLPANARPLYIDSNCGLVPQESAATEERADEEFYGYRVVRTTCSVYPGGSGQPLLAVVMENGRIARDDQGRPRLEALAMVQLGDSAKSGSIFMAFTYETWSELRTHLDTKIEGQQLDILRRNASERDADRRMRIAMNDRIRARTWLTATAVTGNDTACLSATGRAGLESCSAALALPLTRAEAFRVLRRRARLRLDAADTGPGLRDAGLAFQIVQAAPALTLSDSVRAETHGLRGALYHQAALLSDSKLDYDKAVDFARMGYLAEATPAEPTMMIRLLKERAHIHNHLRDWRNVGNDHGDVLALTPDDANARNERCFAYASLGLPRPGELDTALSDCNRALELKPGTAQYLDSRAFVYLKLGRFAEAIRDYDAALGGIPEMAESLFGRGVAKIKMGRGPSGDADIQAAHLVNTNVKTEMWHRGLDRPPVSRSTSTPVGSTAAIDPGAEARFPTRRELLEKEIRVVMEAVRGLLTDSRVSSNTDATVVEFDRYTPFELRLQIRRTPLAATLQTTATETTIVTIQLGRLSPTMAARKHANGSGSDLQLQCATTTTAGSECIEVESAGVRRREGGLAIPLPAKDTGAIGILLKRANEWARQAR